MKGEAEAMDVEEGEGVAEDVRPCDLPYSNDVLGIMDEIFLGEKGPFGFSRGAGGVDDKPGITGSDFDGRGKIRG